MLLLILSRWSYVTIACYLETENCLHAHFTADMKNFASNCNRPQTILFFVEALHKHAFCYIKYLCYKFSHLLKLKMTEGSFVGPDILNLMFEVNFETMASKTPKEAEISSCD